MNVEAKIHIEADDEVISLLKTSLLNIDKIIKSIDWVLNQEIPKNERWKFEKIRSSEIDNFIRLERLIQKIEKELNERRSANTPKQI